MKRLLLAIFLCGCSAQYWEGTGVNQPGTVIRGPSLFGPAKVEVNADANAEIGHLEYTGPETKDGAGSSLKLDNAKFGQTPSTSLPLLPALVTAASEGQRTQTEYAQVWANVVTHIADVAGDFFTVAKLAGIKSTSNGLQMTLPGGFSIGGQKINTPADFQKAMGDIQQAMQVLRAKAPIPTSQPQ